MIISAELTQVARNLIVNAGLVETGALRDTIQVGYMTTPDGQIQFQIQAKYYFEFLMDGIFFIENLTSDPQFANIIATTMAQNIEKQAGLYLNGQTADFNPMPRVSMMINWIY